MNELTPIPPLFAWPADLLYAYRERAAIMEYDGKLPRAEAEAKALRQVWAEQMGQRSL